MLVQRANLERAEATALLELRATPKRAEATAVPELRAILERAEATAVLDTRPTLERKPRATVEERCRANTGSRRSCDPPIGPASTIVTRIPACHWRRQHPRLRYEWRQSSRKAN